MKRSLFLASLTLAALPLVGATAPGSPDVQAKIERALSAGPPQIAEHATVFDMTDKGKMVVIRKGNNGFSCYAGAPGVGNDPFCTNAAGMQWVNDWMMHRKSPSNTKPGIMYMFAGGTDWSATDPWATSGTPIKEPPHWMILYPASADATYETSGLPKTLKMDGTWIMWAGTPYAHLMINQKP